MPLFPTRGYLQLDRDLSVSMHTTFSASTCKFLFHTNQTLHYDRPWDTLLDHWSFSFFEMTHYNLLRCFIFIIIILSEKFSQRGEKKFKQCTEGFVLILWSEHWKTSAQKRWIAEFPLWIRYGLFMMWKDKPISKNILNYLRKGFGVGFFRCLLLPQ